jgi:hypothetical protein
MVFYESWWAYVVSLSPCELRRRVADTSEPVTCFKVQANQKCSIKERANKANASSSLALILPPWKPYSESQMPSNPSEYVFGLHFHSF